MSRIGIKPISIPDGVTVALDGRTVSIKGPKGELAWTYPDVVEVTQDNGALSVSRKDESKWTRTMHGTARSLLANMIEGVNLGYTRELEIQGVGFRGQVQGQKLVLSVGYSHNIEYEPLDGVTVTMPSDTQVVVTGPDKQKVGQVAARIRAFCPAEPYKGKGIRYKDEQIRRKAGKTVA